MCIRDRLQQQADLIRDLETKLERHKAAQRIAGPLQAFDQAEERVRQTAAILEQLLAQLATAKKTEIECQQAAEQALQAKQEQEEPLPVSYTHLDVYKRQELWSCMVRISPIQDSI